MNFPDQLRRMLMDLTDGPTAIAEVKVDREPTYDYQDQQGRMFLSMRSYPDGQEWCVFDEKAQTALLEVLGLTEKEFKKQREHSYGLGEFTVQRQSDQLVAVKIL